MGNPALRSRAESTARTPVGGHLPRFPTLALAATPLLRRLAFRSQPGRVSRSGSHARFPQSAAGVPRTHRGAAHRAARTHHGTAAP